MNITVISTGSKGNSYMIDDGKSKILLECGIPFDEIQAGTGYQLSKIDGCLISHEHGDHALSANKLQNYGIGIYTSQGTAQALNLSTTGLTALKDKQPVKVGGYTVLPFATIHDCAEPLGFVIKSHSTKESIMFATDTHYIKEQFANITYFMLEANYIDSELEHSNSHPEVIKRLVHSHMSMENAIKFLKKQNLSKTKAIYVIHISKDRGNVGIIRRQIARATGKMVVIAGVDN